MKFVVDAQLPRRLAVELARLGHDAIHTTELPLGNATADHDISELADREGRIVMTKDSDFVDGHILYGSPQRLLFISTGNITNDDLIGILRHRISETICAFSESSFVEINRDSMIVRG